MLVLWSHCYVSLCTQAPWPQTPGSHSPSRCLEIVSVSLLLNGGVCGREGVRSGLGVERGGQGPKGEEMKESSRSLGGLGWWQGNILQRRGARRQPGSWDVKLLQTQAS